MGGARKTKGDQTIGFLDRTLGNISKAWREIAAGGRQGDKAAAIASDPRRLRQQMTDCLAGRGGAVSARARAAALGRDYLALTGDGRAAFLKVLAREFDVDHDVAQLAAAKLAAAKDADARRAAERAMRAALNPPRIELLRQFNALPQGLKFLVDMRADLLPMRRTDPALADLDRDLRALLSSWFDVGFLELRRITWNEPAALLEKLIAYEAVHEIRDWRDLKNRLDSDRRCFAFFHSDMADEPLIFVEVALVQGLADAIQPLLDETAPLLDPTVADTAIFYSISNAQKGLAGIRFGDFLIKRVVAELAREFPNLKTFATLSPIPGFAAWLKDRIAADAPPALTEEETRNLAALGGDRPDIAGLLALARTAEGRAQDACRAPLMRLCAEYLLREKQDGKRARDPVADFHLGNGARMERLNWDADRSQGAVGASAGMMINYLYKLSDIERNMEAYSGSGRVVASASLRSLAKE